jgi:hypothetical protein
MPGSSFKSLGRGSVPSSWMQMSTIATPAMARSQSTHLPADCDCPEETTVVTGSFARGIRWAIGLEFGAAFCVYGLWLLWRLH